MFSFIAYIQESNALPSSNILTSIWQLFFFIIAFIFVLILAIYVTRLLATSSYLKAHNKNIKILESIGVGYHNSIQLIKVGNRYILIGNTKEKITLLLDLKEDDITLINQKNQEDIQSSFKKYFNKYLKKESVDKDIKVDNGGEHD